MIVLHTSLEPVSVRKLKEKYQKIKIKRIPGGEKLIHPILFSKLIKIKPKQGRWCEYYEGRLPYPMECQYNKNTPVGMYVRFGEIVHTYDRLKCVDCNRAPQWHSWKKGDWDKIIEAIANLEDLRDMEPPRSNEETL